MVQYIDKSALVAEIEKQQRKLCLLGQSHEVELRKSAAIQNGVYYSFLSFIDTLEVKEVDLEKEIKEEYLERREYGDKFNMLVILNESQFNNIAKHFFELGIKKSVDDSLIRKIVDLNNEAAKHYDAIIKKERYENGFSQLAIDLLDHNVDANELRIQYIIENLKAQKGEKI